MAHTIKLNRWRCEERIKTSGFSKCLLIQLCSLILCLSACDIALSQAREVAEIRVVGLKQIPSENVLLTMSVKVGDILTEEDLRARLAKDMDRIWQLGFFARRPDYDFELDERGRWIITVRLVEHAVVREIVIEGNTAISTEELTSTISTKVGQILNEAVLARDIDRIRELYRGKGFLAEVEAVDFDDATGRLTLKIAEAFVTGIKFEGLKKTKEKILRMAILTKVGDLFNRERLSEDWRRLNDLGLFKSVDIEPRPDEQGSGIVVTYKLEEQRTGMASAGIGASSRGEFVGYVMLQENNLAGLAQRLRLEAEFFERRTWGIYYERPYMNNRGLMMSAHIYDTRFYREPRAAWLIVPQQWTLQDVLFTEERRGIRVTLRQPRSREDDRTWYTLGLRNEDVSFTQRGYVGGILQEIGPTRSQGRIMALQFGYERDTRDIRFDPSKGQHAILSVDLATKVLGGEHSFARAGFEWRFYRAVGRGILPITKEQRVPKNVFAARFMLGTSLGSPPVFENYFVGGSENLRGYSIDRFVGKHQAVLNMELRHRLNRNVQIVLFADAGDAWGGQHSIDFEAAAAGRRKIRESIDLKYGYGVGVRFITPLGLLRFDYAINDEGKSKFHVSVGQLF
ncbi:MAG: POTRA domain-containing protein [Armatimonadota bacterium]|nr:BamA/TamA family outer membrane protein [Armatimonadota bacterium]MCX7777792.1 BamA/TamA family outer membrane protein [Armatimonadota bacterium]MDW8025321.1 POTRA domain-containing protein [Armatimonadota bacterium]